MRALVWMLGTLLSFSLMAVCARELSGEIATHQTLFVRSAIGLICISTILVASKNITKIQTTKLGLHSVRNIFHFAGQYGWFLGIGLLPLAEVFALEFTVPIWTLIIAAVALGERITVRKLMAVALGFIGVAVILRPGIAAINDASLIVLASAVCYAISHTTTKSLSSSESALSILFYMCVIQLPIGLLLSLSDWIWPTGPQWIWLLIIGLTALTAHYCMTNAMRHAEAGIVVTLDFLRLPLIALVGVLIYSEPFELSLLIGGLLMLAGNVINLKRRSPSSSVTADKAIISDSPKT